MKLFGGSHLSDAIIVELADGLAVPASLHERDQKHLRGCDQCAVRLNGHRRAADLLLRGRGRQPLPAPRPASRIGVWSIAAPVAVGLIVVAAVSLQPRAAIGPATGSSPEAKATPTAVHSAVAPSGLTKASWMRIASAGSISAAWSPAGDYLIVMKSPAANGSPTIELYDRAGNTVRSIDGDRAAWLSSGRILVAKGPNGRIEPVAAVGATSVGTVWKDALPGRDVVAVPTGNGRFEIRGPGGTLAAATGVPVAWSPDGSRLAVFHASGASSGISASQPGSLSVVTWPGLIDIGVTAKAARETPSFDASGTHLAFADPSESRVGVIDLQSKKVTLVGPTDELPSFAWTGPNLVVVSASSGIDLVDAAGVATNVAPGDTVIGSSGGDAALGLTANTAAPLTVVTIGGKQLIEAPGAVTLTSRISSGGVIAAVVATPHGEELQLLVR